jgi:ribosomal protein L11 methyltransferase
MASPPGRASIILEPTLSFGSGLHPTTRLTMELIERHVGPDTRVLDLGSGSGILSIALAKLGAHVTALDNDPVAVEATRRNVRINGVEQLVRVGHGSLGQGARLGYWIGGVELGPVMEVDIGQGYAVIVANILARVHIALAHDYRRALREDDQQSSLLIVAGFTTDQEDEVLAALRSAQLEPIERRQAEEMVALALGLVRS